VDPGLTCWLIEGVVVCLRWYRVDGRDIDSEFKVRLIGDGDRRSILADIPCATESETRLDKSSFHLVKDS
jgi:hypothetical protein